LKGGIGGTRSGQKTSGTGGGPLAPPGRGGTLVAPGLGFWPDRKLYPANNRMGFVPAPSPAGPRHPNCPTPAAGYSKGGGGGGTGPHSVSRALDAGNRPIGPPPPRGGGGIFFVFGLRRRLGRWVTGPKMRLVLGGGGGRGSGRFGCFCSINKVENGFLQCGRVPLVSSWRPISLGPPGPPKRPRAGAGGARKNSILFFGRAPAFGLNNRKTQLSQKKIKIKKLPKLRSGGGIG